MENEVENLKKRIEILDDKLQTMTDKLKEVEKILKSKGDIPYQLDELYNDTKGVVIFSTDDDWSRI